MIEEFINRVARASGAREHRKAKYTIWLFTEDELHTFAEAMMTAGREGADIESVKEPALLVANLDLELSAFTIDPTAVAPLYVQRVTPDTWAITDARGKPVVLGGGKVIDPFYSKQMAAYVQSKMQQIQGGGFAFVDES